MGARRSFKTRSPRFVPALRGWMDLSAASQSGGEWTGFVDVMNNNPGTTNAARRPAAAAANNGLPIATFASNDAVSVPLVSAINNQTTRLGWALWAKVGDLVGFNTLLSISSGTGGASAAKLQLFVSSTEAITVDAYIGSGNGRRFTTTATIPQDTWTFVRLAYNSDGGGDANVSVFINGVLQPGSFSNLGAGGTLTTLPTVTGNLIIGNINNGSASAALNGSIGPDIFFLGEDIPTADELRLMNYRIPT